MSASNFSIECVKITPEVEVLLIAGDGNALFLFLNRVWLKAIFMTELIHNIQNHSTHYLMLRGFGGLGLWGFGEVGRAHV